MGVFDKILKDNESLFVNEVVLDYDYLPKNLPYRENEQHKVASCMKPLFQQRNAGNAIVYGVPGIGKTASIKKILEELNEQTDEIISVYVNCWENNTTFKIILEICEKLGYKRTQNRNTHELMKEIIFILNKNKTCSALVFDEIDKAEDFNFLYTLLEQVYRKSIILITNYKEDLVKMDERVKSRLVPETIEFRPYNLQETQGILKQRMDLAFAPNIFSANAFKIIAQKTFDMKDLRKGLYLLKESANLSESKSKRDVGEEEVNIAIDKMESFSSKNMELIEDVEKEILELVKNNDNSKVGDLHKMYEKAFSEMGYKTFKRKLDKLEKQKFILCSTTGGGEGGNTSVVSYIKDKKLSEY